VNLASISYQAKISLIHQNFMDFYNGSSELVQTQLFSWQPTALVIFDESY